MSMIVKSVPEKSLLIGRHAADEIGTIESATGTIGRIVHRPAAKQRHSSLQRARNVASPREELGEMSLEIAPASGGR